MKRFFRFVILLLCCLKAIGTVAAEVENCIFSVMHLGLTEGLGSQRVFSIAEDKEGVMWIATKAGIDRYNGRNVKHYDLEGNYFLGDLAGRRIYLLYDERNGLWAYDHTGRIYRYSAREDRFEQVLSLGEAIRQEEIILNKLLIDEEGTFWIGLSEGLYKRSTGGDVVSVIQGVYVNDIITMGRTLFAGTSTGVWQVPLSLLGQAEQVVEEQNVQALAGLSARRELWIGTFNNGVWIKDLEQGSLQPLKGQTEEFMHPIRAIVPYGAHTMLVGIDGGGVYATDCIRKEARLLMNTEDNEDAYLLGRGIYAVRPDRQGNIWIGSYTGGVSVAVLQKYPIGILKHERGNPQSLADNNINGICENIDGALWFATDLGISIQHADRHTWSHHLKKSVVVTLCRGKGGTMWAGTYGDGIYRLDSRGNVLGHLTKQQGGLTTNYLFSIRQDDDGELWAGGLEGGLMRLTENGQLMQSYDIHWVHSIQTVDSLHMAVATVNGFYLLDKRGGEPEHYAAWQDYRDNLNSSAYIVSMLFNGDGTVWLGTEGGGMNLYDMRSRKQQIFTTREGLPSNDIYSLQRDSRGRLWVSTGKGLALMDDSLRIASLNYLGEIDKEYNKSSMACLSDGRFAYGSTRGAVLLMPEAIAVTDYGAPLRFTGIEVETDSEEATRLRPLLHDGMEAGKVRLSYSHRSFTVRFESINYRFQRDIVYQYILEGYEPSWSAPSDDGYARYTNVSPGSYRLRVRSLRQSDGKVISEGFLRLHIASPWWDTWWAWTLYLCLAVLMLYFVWRYKINQLQKKYDEDKIRFFINTAHDIRTPVTLIQAPLEDLYREKELSENARSFLELAYGSARKLNDLVSQLLDFEKMDANGQQPETVVLNLNELLSEEAANFQAYCDRKGLRLSLDLTAETVYVRAGRHALEMLLDNLVSNACKYTRPQGEICLRLRCTRREALIEVEDTGIGIPKQAYKHLFTDIYRAENARRSNEGGTGFGLLQVRRIVKMLHGKVTFRSEENRGSCFTVTLNRTEAAPRQEVAEAVPSRDASLPTLPATGFQATTDTPAGTDGGGKETLLIVEDHEALRYYLRRTFEPDYRVVDVSNGQEALDYLAKEYPDLILSDVMMPGVQGDELCRLVKENPDTSGIPFVLLTAKVNQEAVADGLRKGADDYIPKPFSTEILKLKVQGLIGNRKRLRSFFMRQALEQVEQEVPLAEAPPSAPDRTANMPASSTETTPEEQLPQTSLSESDRNFVMQATRLVLDHLDDTEFNINYLCREMGMSRTLFFSRLKSLTGKGPQEFIRLLRLQKAAELLKQGRCVAEVAADTGFVNVKYFSQLFRKQFGVQPSKYGQTKEEINTL